MLPFALLLLLSGISSAESLEWTRAHEHFLRTNYHESLAQLIPMPARTPGQAPGYNAAELQLIGQDYFMLGEYKKATDFLEQAVAHNPGSAETVLWLGRAYGRRAETSGPFTAPGYASKARQMLERAVTLDPTNREAVGDLFDYYLDAPSFLGGGQNKAEALAARVAVTDPAEGHYYQAQLAEHRKEFDTAEQHLRKALELAPRQAGRFVDLAKLLAMRGRTRESDALFAEAEQIAPDNPKLLFEHAETYIKEGRNLDEARRLLRRYLQAHLTPNDPPKSDAETLLRKIGP